jgi:hypothetical protein
MRHSEPASRPSPYGADLRSSLDPDPSLAFVSTEPGNQQKPVTTTPMFGVDTAPLLQG